MIKLLGHLYTSAWIVFYISKWLLLLGVPILYTLTPVEPHLIINILWFIALSAIVWDIVVKFMN